MSSIGELIAQFKAEKQTADELEAEIVRSNVLADELIEQTSAIGFEGKAAQIMEAKAQAERAQNARWLAEGHLEDAIAILQAVIDGQKSVGAKIPGGAADQGGSPQNGAAARPAAPEGESTNADPEELMGTKLGGETSYVTEWNGSPVKITYKDPEPEHEPGPSGQNLLDETRPRNRFEALNRALIKEDGSDPAKSLTQSINNISSLFRNESAPPPKPATEQTYTGVPQPPPAEIHAMPQARVGAGDLAVAAMAVTVVGMKAGSSLAGAMQSLRGRIKERRADDQG